MPVGGWWIFWFFVFFVSSLKSSVPVGGFRWISVDFLVLRCFFLFRRCPSVDGGIFVFFGFFLEHCWWISVDFLVPLIVLFFCFLGAHRWMVDFFGFVDAFMLVAVVGAMGRVEVPWPSRVW